MGKLETAMPDTGAKSSEEKFRHKSFAPETCWKTQRAEGLYGMHEIHAQAGNATHIFRQEVLSCLKSAL